MKLLVIGAGMMGSAAAYDMAQQSRVESVTLADTDTKRAKEAERTVSPEDDEPFHARFPQVCCFIGAQFLKQSTLENLIGNVLSRRSQPGGLKNLRSCRNRVSNNPVLKL